MILAFPPFLGAYGKKDVPIQQPCFANPPHLSLFIITYKFRLAAAAAIIGGVRCHHWQRPLPIMSPPAANLKSTPLFPLRCLPLPVCRAQPLLNAPHFVRHQQCSPACHHFFANRLLIPQMSPLRKPFCTKKATKKQCAAVFHDSIGFRSGLIYN